MFTVNSSIVLHVGESLDLTEILDARAKAAVNLFSLMLNRASSVNALHEEYLSENYFSFKIQFFKQILIFSVCILLSSFLFLPISIYNLLAPNNNVI